MLCTTQQLCMLSAHIVVAQQLPLSVDCCICVLIQQLNGVCPASASWTAHLALTHNNIPWWMVKGCCWLPRVRQSSQYGPARKAYQLDQVRSSCLTMAHIQLLRTPGYLLHSLDTTLSMNSSLGRRGAALETSAERPGGLAGAGLTTELSA